MTLNIPDSIDLNEIDAKMIIASRLYEKSKVTLGQAADLVGVSKLTFMELLFDYNVPIINHATTDLDEDIKNAKNYCF